MKKAIQLAVIVMAMLPAISFGQAKKAVWAEMKTFHSFMAATFHPAEEGNLAPLRAKADSLLIAAEQWQKAEVPSNFKPEETKNALAKLVKECAIIKKAVNAKVSDGDLTKLITNTHDTFHAIVGECKKADD